MTKKHDVFSEKDKKIIYLFAKKCLKLRTTCILDTSVLTPTNFQKEKLKFMHSKTYNPRFTYKKISVKKIVRELETLRNQLEIMRLPQDLAIYFLDYIDNLELLSKTVQSIGLDTFPELTKKLFNISVSNAHDVLQTLPKIAFQEEKKPTMHSAEEIASIFHEYLQTYHELYNYKIYLDTFNDHTIRVGEKQLVIGSRVKRTASNVNRLIVHEIESHILQRYNTKIGKNPLVRLICAGEHDMLSEGLAVFNEVYTKTITHKAYATYFYRLKAVEMLNCSFREIYTYLTNFVTPHQSFIITARVKRGMTDTSKPGGFPKDASYLLGYDKINKYVSDGGDLPFLYIVRNPEYGKILAKYNLLTTADYVLPKFLRKKSLLQPLQNQLAILN
ncbi:MAG TPA: tyrosine/phenylalanine carboxypeptidase domain-containing protein [Candidatus Saccharimonadales bacterium]|nr:tyrosine/phenylalanine carboxypeptidase domain-containing protein [Candidatus Saccharimonadales bacterium]